MKTILNKYPITSKFILAILLFGFSLFLSGLINKGFIKEYFPYSSVILLTIATWYLYKFDKKSLNEIGLNLKLKKLLYLPLGIIIGASVFLLAKYLRAIYLVETFNLNTSINYKTIAFAMYTILPTVAVEEFLFRG